MHISTAHNEPMKGTYTMKKHKKLRDELVDEILSLTDNPADFFNEKNLFLDLQKAVMERALQGELGHHLGYPKHGERIAENSRNGISLKRGCHNVCVKWFWIGHVLDNPIRIENSKLVKGQFPLSDGHGPSFLSVLQG